MLCLVPLLWGVYLCARYHWLQYIVGLVIFVKLIFCEFRDEDKFANVAKIIIIIALQKNL